MPWQELHRPDMMMTRGNDRIYLLIHTMTITECGFVIQAQYFHAIPNGIDSFDNARFVGRRFTLRLHPNLRTNRNKIGPLKTLMKKRPQNIRHHLRAVHIGTANRGNPLKNQLLSKSNDDIRSIHDDGLSTPSPPLDVTEKKVACNEANSINLNDQIVPDATPEQTAAWLTLNRFGKYLQTFANFSGADLLRMSREDLIQICGHADGIRLYNALKARVISPKLTIYVSRDKTKAFNAIFLSTYNASELMQKLCGLYGLPLDQVKDVYLQGPENIHIHLNTDVLRNIKEETMFSLDVLQENGEYVFVLKRMAK